MRGGVSRAKLLIMLVVLMTPERAAHEDDGRELETGGGPVHGEVPSFSPRETPTDQPWLRAVQIQSKARP